jgi:hypothetical protein
MNSLDKKLYELFADKTLKDGCMILHERTRYGKFLRHWDWEYIVIENNKEEVFYKNEETYNEILWHEPQLHDVFRLAKERYWKYYSIDIRISYEIFEYYIWWDEEYKSIPYNPTLPLLQQEESTKEKIISLFS